MRRCGVQIGGVWEGEQPWRTFGMPQANSLTQGEVICLLNLEDNVLEVFREPGANGYRETRVLQAGEAIAPMVFPDLAVRVGDFLP